MAIYKSVYIKSGEYSNRWGVLRAQYNDKWVVLLEIGIFVLVSANDMILE